MKSITYIGITIILLSLSILSCKESNLEPYQPTALLPFPQTSCPDTISNSTEHIDIQFNFSTSEYWLGFDIEIVSESENHISMKIYESGKEENEISGNKGKFKVGTYRINVSGKKDFSINFLDDNDNIAISRKVIVVEEENNYFTFELKPDPFTFRNIDEIGIEFNNNQNDFLYIQNAKIQDNKVRVILKDIPSNINELEYRITLDTISQGTFLIYDTYGYKMKRGIPEVLKRIDVE